MNRRRTETIVCLLLWWCGLHSVQAFTGGVAILPLTKLSFIKTTTSTTTVLHAIKLPFLSNNPSTATTTTSTTTTKTMIPTKSKLTPIQRLKIQQYQNNNNNNNDDDTMNDSTTPSTTLSKFDQFKSLLYSVSDTIAATTTPPTPIVVVKGVGTRNKNNNNNKKSSSSNSNTNKVYDGFNSKSFQQTTSKSGSFPFSMTAFQSPFAKTVPSVVVVDVPTKPPSLFDTLKGTVYNTADFITSSSKATNTAATNKPSPVQRMSSKSIVKKNGNTAPVSPGNDPFTQLKEGFYTMNDIIAKTIETVPTIPQKVERTSQQTMTFVTRTIPNRAQDTVQTVTSIPNRMEQSITNVQSTVETKMEQTKQFLQSIQAIPEQVQDTVTTTQTSLQSAQASLQDMTTSLQVQLGLRTPVVQPPKQVPPVSSPKSTEHLLWDVAWTGTRTVGTIVGQSMLWLGQTSFDMAKTTLEDTIQKQQQVTASPKTSTTPTFNINDDDILATLKMAEEAIALASDAVTTPKTIDTEQQSDVSMSLSSTTTPFSTTTTNAAVAVDDAAVRNDYDDLLDIMATLQMANDAIALAESVTTTTNSDTGSSDDRSGSTVTTDATIRPFD